MFSFGSFGLTAEAMEAFHKLDAEREKRQLECAHHWDWERTPLIGEWKRWCFKCGKWDDGKIEADA